MRGVGSLDVNAIGKDVLPRDLSARCAKYTRRPRRVASERSILHALLAVGFLVGSLSMANEESNVPHAYHTRAVRLQRRGLQVYRQNVSAHANSPSGGIVTVSYQGSNLVHASLIENVRGRDVQLGWNFQDGLPTHGWECSPKGDKEGFLVDYYANGEVRSAVRTRDTTFAGPMCFFDKDGKVKSVIDVDGKSILDIPLGK